MAETALLIGALTLSAGGSILGGISAKKAAEDRADLQRQQADLARDEAELEATRKEDERTRFIAKQKVAYLANGVGLSGTGVTVLSNTFDEFQQEIDAIRDRGTAEASLLEQEADITEKSGRSALLGGILDAGATVTGGVLQGKKDKIF